MTQAHEHDLASIETIIRQAKERRARHMAEVAGPTLRTVAGFALVIIMMPWQAIRQTMTTLGS